MANYFSRIEKYMSNAVDTVFATESKTALLENGAKYIDVNFKEVGYVKILNILMDGLSDYYRVNHVGVEDSESYAHDNSHNGVGSRDGYDRGNVQGTWEILKLKYDRGRQFLVDNMDDEEMAGSIIANLLSEFLRTKVVPEVDAVRFSKIASKCSTSLGNYIEQATGDLEGSIIAQFNEAFEWLTENEVPEEEQVIFVNPKVYTLIMNTSELNKVINQESFTTEKGIKFTLPAYNGRPIIVVPTTRFFTNVKTTSNGYTSSTTSKAINYMVVSKKAIVPVVKLQKSKIWSPDTQDDFDGYKVNFRMYHDVVIPANKIIGCYVSVNDETLSTNKHALGKLSVNAKVNAKDEKLLVESIYTKPAGLLGTLCIDSTKPTLGEEKSFGSGSDAVKVITIGEPCSLSAYSMSSGSRVYFYLVDGKGKVIAISDEILLSTIRQ